MREILMISTEFPPFAPRSVGGVGVWMHAIADGLQRRGRRMRVIAVNTTEQDRVFDAQQPYPIERMPRRLYHHARTLAIGRALRGARRRGGHPQALLVGSRQCARTPLRMAKRWGVPSLLFCHGQEWLPREEPRAAARVRAIVEGTPPDRYVANSAFTASLLARWNVPSASVVPGRPIADLAPMRDAPRARLRDRLGLTDEVALLSVGRLVERKGYLQVMEALHQLRESHPNLHYLIAGDGPLAEQIETRVQALGLEQRVHRLGFVDRDGIPETLAACDVFVMATQDRSGTGSVEGYGIVYVEAGAAGKPVLATNAGGVGDVVLDGINGMLLPHGSQASLTEAIATLADDAALRTRLGNGGQALAFGEHGADAQLQALEAVIDHLVEASA